MSPTTSLDKREHPGVYQRRCRVDGCTQGGAMPGSLGLCTLGHVDLASETEPWALEPGPWILDSETLDP